MDVNSLYQKWKRLEANFYSHDWYSEGLKYKCVNCGIYHNSRVFKMGLDYHFTEACAGDASPAQVWWDNLPYYIQDIIL